METIAPFLNHPEREMRVSATEGLRATQNPKAVPSLVAALNEVEKQLPPALPDEVTAGATADALMPYCVALSMIRGPEALAALDATIERLRKLYGTSKFGKELVKMFEFMAQTGGMEPYRPTPEREGLHYAERADTAPGNAAAAPVATPRPSKAPAITTVSAARFEPTLWVFGSLTLLAALVCGWLWWRRKG